MKLYTEQQVREAIAMGYDWCHQKHIPSDHMIEAFIDSLTPIKLSSDEEIEEQSNREFYSPSFAKGAKWMRDKILNK